MGAALSPIDYPKTIQASSSLSRSPVVKRLLEALLFLTLPLRRIVMNLWAGAFSVSTAASQVWNL